MILVRYHQINTRKAWHTKDLVKPRKLGFFTQTASELPEKVLTWQKKIYSDHKKSLHSSVPFKRQIVGNNIWSLRYIFLFQSKEAFKNWLRTDYTCFETSKKVQEKGGRTLSFVTATDATTHTKFYII